MIYQLSRYCLIIVIGAFLQSCIKSMTPEKEMIEFAISDSTLYQDLMIYGPKSDFVKVKEGKFKYSVHNLLNSSMIDYNRSDCFAEMDVSGKAVDILKSQGLNKFNYDLSKLSQSDSAIVHLFFTERVQNLRGLAVLYRDKNKVPIADINSDPLTFVWDMNRGRFYLFKFKEGTMTIESVCKEIILNE